MGRPIFYVERFNGERWITMLAAPHQIGPSDVRGPDQFPPAESPGNVSAFTGFHGAANPQARVRVDDTVVELFDWSIVLTNPLDPTSPTKWGWKSVMRNYQAVPLHMDGSGLSFLG